jgi:hypothetical protein
LPRVFPLLTIYPVAVTAISKLASASVPHTFSSSSGDWWSMALCVSIMALTETPLKDFVTSIQITVVKIVGIKIGNHILDAAIAHKPRKKAAAGELVKAQLAYKEWTYRLHRSELVNLSPKPHY